ncbi:MAG: hypothetical protein NTX57_05360 [Armatimonadetes bacterium]|jgi:hypothetical protein|nr:hypothetical protein [Armatimonadota bacterium]
MELSPEQVTTTVKAWQPTAQERTWEKIGWAASLQDALMLAKREKRLVFLFTLDGRMQRGRC